MSAAKEYKVEVTQLKISLPFLKISAKNLSSSNYRNLQCQLKSQYEKATNRDRLKLGEMCIANTGPNKYERCYVIHVNDVGDSALLTFIDCGYQGTLPSRQLRLLKDEATRTMKPLHKIFTLSGIIINQTDDYLDKIWKLHDMIIGKSVKMIIVDECEAGILVDLWFGSKSLCQRIIPNHSDLKTLTKPIPTPDQKTIMMNKKKELEEELNRNMFNPETFVGSPDLKRRKHLKSKFDILLNVDPHVRITAYDDEDPTTFYVQIRALDEEYQKFQCNLNNLNTRALAPLRTTVTDNKCLVQVDRELKRAIIIDSNERLQRNQKLVRLMESGASFIVSSNKLFVLPNELAKPEQFALKFKLAGVQGHPTPLNRNIFAFFFQHITKQKLLNLRIVREEGPDPRCELIDDEGVNILEECKNFNPRNLRFTPQKPLRNLKYNVRVCSGDSPKLFHVQLLNSNGETGLENIIASMKNYNPPELTDLLINDVCMVQHQDVGMRGRVLNKITSEVFQVEYVDFGFVDDHHTSEIKMMVKEFVKTPPIAFSCCLKGFEKVNHVKSKTEGDFERLCRQHKDFQMKVVTKKDEIYIVELSLPSGSSVYDELNEKLNSTDWTDNDPNIGTDFDGRRTNDETNWSNDSSPESSGRSGNVSVQISNATVSRSLVFDWDNLEEGDSITSEKSDSSDDNNWDSVSEVKSPKAGPSRQPKKGKLLDSVLDWSQTSAPVSVARSNSSSTSTSGIGSMTGDIDLKRVPIRITHVTNLNDFTIQELSKVQEFYNFVEELQNVANSQGPLTAFSVGSFCLTYDMFTSKWFRATIIDADLNNFMITVASLDEGKTCSITTCTYLKTIPLMVVFKPYYGIRCSLPVSHELGEEAQATRSLTAMMNSNLTMRYIVEFKQNFHFIELFEDDQSVVDIFIKKGFAKRQIVAPRGPAYINYINSITDFSVHMESDDVLLKQIQAYTDQYDKTVNVNNPEVGMLVLALHRSENAWYRAIIKAIKGKKFEVYFIDHGNCATLETIGCINDQTIAKVHPLAIRCSLVVKQGYTKFSDQDQKFFKDFAAKGETRVDVRMVNPGDEFAVVDIIHEGQSIFKKLITSSNGAGTNEF